MTDKLVLLAVGRAAPIGGLDPTLSPYDGDLALAAFHGSAAPDPVEGLDGYFGDDMDYCGACRERSFALNFGCVNMRCPGRVRKPYPYPVYEIEE